jgi:hypothetical protein
MKNMTLTALYAPCSRSAQLPTVNESIGFWWRKDQSSKWEMLIEDKEQSINWSRMDYKQTLLTQSVN